DVHRRKHWRNQYEQPGMESHGFSTLARDHGLSPHCGTSNEQEHPRSLIQSSFMPKRVSLFVTCVVDQLFPRVGLAMAEVIERCGYQVDFPEDQTCCGQPAFNTGYLDEARQVARHFQK